MAANEKEVEIVIGKDGTISADMIGWEGKGCHGAVDDLLKKIGTKVRTRRKQGFFKEDQVRISQRTN